MTTTYDPAGRRRQLAEARAAQAAAEQQALAALPVPVQAAVAQSQRPDALTGLLDRAPGVAVPPLPPVEIAREHSGELAKLITEATDARTRQRASINRWRECQPGTKAFIDACADADVDEIVALIVDRPARAWATAWISIRDAEQATQAVRDFGHMDPEVHQRLEDRVGQLTAEIVNLLRQARDRRQRLPLARADELLTEWRKARSLQRWALGIDAGFVQLDGNSAPVELVSLYRQAARANDIDVGPDEMREGKIIDGQMIVTSGPPPPWEDDPEPDELEAVVTSPWQPLRQMLGRT